MPAPFDVICLSHLRWELVFQRPHHLMTRFARERRVFFVEEGVDHDGDVHAEVRHVGGGVTLVRPHFSVELPVERMDAIQQTLLDELMVEYEIERYALWFYAPMAVGFTRHLTPVATVYDCMDELSLFKNPPPGLQEREAELFERADLVFTGGLSLYEAKRARHPDVHLFPSAVDAAHFAQARERQDDPPDQAPIPHPRLGYAGVIDERLDHELLAGIAAARPGWQLVMLGPVSEKIDEAELARAPNVHYLGRKRYDELPAYLAGWDVALMPFALNEATRFISPTKTPEYLAAGLPVVSTPIADVVRPYGELGLVRIAATTAEFVAAAGRALAGDAPPQRAVDEHLATISWDATWAAMRDLLEEAAAGEPGRRRRRAIIRSTR